MMFLGLTEAREDIAIWAVKHHRVDPQVTIDCVAQKWGLTEEEKSKLRRRLELVAGDIRGA